MAEPKFTLDGTGSEPPADGGSVAGNSSGASSVDPATLAGTGDGGNGPQDPPKRGRGRPKGTGKTGGQEKASLDVASIEVLLFNIHGMLAAATQIEKLALAETEAKSLAAAVANVQKFYPMHISAKALAWTNLTMVAGSVYGSRIVAVYADMKTAEREANASTHTGNGNVTSLRP